MPPPPIPKCPACVGEIVEVEAWKPPGRMDRSGRCSPYPKDARAVHWCDPVRANGARFDDLPELVVLGPERSEIRFDLRLDFGLDDFADVSCKGSPAFLASPVPDGVRPGKSELVGDLLVGVMAV